MPILGDEFQFHDVIFLRIVSVAKNFGICSSLSSSQIIVWLLLGSTFQPFPSFSEDPGHLRPGDAPGAGHLPATLRPDAAGGGGVPRLERGGGGPVPGTGAGERHGPTPAAAAGGGQAFAPLAQGDQRQGGDFWGCSKSNLEGSLGI